MDPDSKNASAYLLYHDATANQTTNSNGTMNFEGQGTGLWLQGFVKIASIYFIPVIIATGFVGNIMSFLVFVVSNLKRISTSVYLAALAVSDTGFLLCVWVGWFDNMGIHFFHNNGICQLVVFMTFVFSFTSVWFVNAFTTEMYLCVFHSSKAQRICRPSFARKVVIGITAFAVIFYSFSLWTSSVHEIGGQRKCQFLEHAEAMVVLSIIDTFLTLLIPFSMIIFMIMRLLVDISRLYSNTGMTDDGDSTSQSYSQVDTAEQEVSDMATESSLQRQHSQQANKAQSKIKRMLVVVVVVFLVLNLPSHAIRVQFFIRTIVDSSNRFTQTEVLWQHLFQILYYINFSINFILYSGCAKRFRMVLLQLPHKICNGTQCFKTRCLRRIAKGRKADKCMEQNSHLADIHLSAIRLSEVPSFDTGYIYKSPPCLLSPDSTAL